jgi:hypothetical protein
MGKEKKLEEEVEGRKRKTEEKQKTIVNKGQEVNGGANQ